MGKLTKPLDELKTVTLADVAAHCGLSTAAVSWALRGIRSQVSDATIARVQAAAHELGYDPTRHTSARRLAMRRMGVEVLNRQVALLVPSVFHETNYHILMFRGVMDVLTPARYGLITSCPIDDSVSSLPDTFVRGELDGLIVLGALEGCLGLVDALRQHEGFGPRPAVSLTIGVKDCSAVLFDDFAGGYAIAQHLLDLGHRYLAVHDGTDSRGRQKHQGILAAYTERGLNPDTYLQKYIWHSDRLQESGDNFIDLLESNRQITGITAPNDLDAGHIMRRLQQAGYRVPEDYSLTGFDDTDAIINTQGENILTTVHVPLREAGQFAARCLLDRITQRTSELSTIVMPVFMVLRTSTAPPRS